MRFSLYSLGPDNERKACYFGLHTESHIVYSPVYPDRVVAHEAMENLVRRLRRAFTDARFPLKKRGEEFMLYLFENTQVALGEGAAFPDQESADKGLKSWQSDAKATAFKITYFVPDEVPDGLVSIRDLDLAALHADEGWQEAEQGLLHVGKEGGFAFKPAVGLQLNPMRKRCEPVFNALQPFVSADLPLFHGRNREVDEVEALVKEHNLLLLYGAPQVGKTSLLQCGLANRMEKDIDRMIVVQRRGQDILAQLAVTLREELSARRLEDIPETFDPLPLARQMEAASEKPNIIVFDQLEYLFDPGIDQGERQSFFRFVSELVRTEDTPSKIILVLREDFLAPLVDFEAELPPLMENRYRLLPIQEGSMVDATVNLLDVLHAQDKISLDDSESVAQKVVGQLANERGEVPVQCLQVYLHQLHQKSCAAGPDEGPVAMNEEVMERFGPARTLIDEFYDEKLKAVSSRLSAAGDEVPVDPALQKELAELESGRMTCGSNDKKKAVAAAAVVAPVPAPFSSALLLALAALPFGLFFLYWWLNPANEGLSACEIAQREDSCEAYVSYLCTFGDEAECTADFAAILEERNCDIWRDYQSLSRNDNCTAYQAFFTKYEKRDICLDLIREKLVDWGCPVVRDTLQLTLRDTIVERVNVPVPTPGIYGGGGGPVSPGNNPPCQEFNSVNFKSVGPLWITTDDLTGGPFSWADALDACRARGFRLPCIGEIDYLIERIYRGEPDRAYAMLAGGGSCTLFNPNNAPSGRIAFWTATEADDDTAWTYYFDTSAKILGRESATPKSAQLPCLCVQRDANSEKSGIPPCYEKSVGRGD